MMKQSALVVWLVALVVTPSFLSSGGGGVAGQAFLDDEFIRDQVPENCILALEAAESCVLFTRRLNCIRRVTNRFKNTMLPTFFDANPCSVLARLNCGMINACGQSDCAEAFTGFFSCLRDEFAFEGSGCVPVDTGMTGNSTDSMDGNSTESVSMDLNTTELIENCPNATDSAVVDLLACNIGIEMCSDYPWFNP